MANTNISNLIPHLADLANLSIDTKEGKSIAADFETTLATIDNLASVDVAETTETHQVTGLENVTRAYEVDETQMFTQAEALSNANNVHDGMFVVPMVLTNKE